MKNNLSVIKGQDDILEYITDTISRDALNLYPRIKPLTILFTGKSGVGKSEVAKILADTITGIKPIILNMTEYNSPSAINRIIGAPAGYIGSDSKAELPFDILESNPYQVILLDEFEKSDRSVQRLFMSAFDEGYIKTNRGKIIDFSKTIIIATTNAGHTTKGETIGFTQNDNDSTSATVSDLSSFFDLELLNRFTKILNFHPITETLFREILKDTYERDIRSIKNRHSTYSYLNDTLSDDEMNALVKEHYHKEFGARPIKKAIKTFIEDKVLAAKHLNSHDDTALDSNDQNPDMMACHETQECMDNGTEERKDTTSCRSL